MNGTNNMAPRLSEWVAVVSWFASSYHGAVADIYAGHAGVVSDVHIDEGTMVAEGDLIMTITLDSTGEELPVPAVIPGVLRELHVDVGSSVDDGDLLAYIDES